MQKLERRARPKGTASYIDQSVDVVQRKKTEGMIRCSPLPSLDECGDLSFQVGMGRKYPLG